MIGSWSAPADVRPERNRPPCGAKCQEDQDQARYTAGGSGGDRRLQPEAGMVNPPSGDPHQSGSDRPATVLVVDDDPTLQTMVLDYFVDNNIQTLLASGREEMLRQLSTQEVNVVILDLRLGVEDGLDALRELRSSFDVPVIIITGHRRDEIDRVIGLELGADDYMTKPFNLRELLARVRAIIRRLDRVRASPAHEPERGGYRFSGWQLDLRTRRLTDPNGADIVLTKGEYAVLVAFLNAPQRPLRLSPDGREVGRGNPRRSNGQQGASAATGEFQGFGYCVTSVTRQRTPSSTLENTALPG
jgi:two-component system, OmpR family, response regulator